MNLYFHFPFCRRKCEYCALLSRAGSTEDERARYVARLAEDLKLRGLSPLPNGARHTVYFGGGTPALCELEPLFKALGTDDDDEFTVELNPLDVSDSLLSRLANGGVNRISMGVESLDDAILARMGRDYNLDFAADAFAKAASVIPNCGIDLIVGYPDESDASFSRLCELSQWNLRHCSVYSLILEEKSQLGAKVGRGIVNRRTIPSDDLALDRIKLFSAALSEMGLRRYEISSYAVPGCECRHNLSVWLGEDYLGFGEGAAGREGLVRTLGVRSDDGLYRYVTESVDALTDLKERTLFRLRTTEGLNAEKFPTWRPELDRQVGEGLLVRDGCVYRLTERGTEVCDAILAQIV